MQMCEQFPRGGNVGEILRKFPPLPFSEVREGWIIRERAVRKRTISMFSFQNKREGLSKRLNISVSHRG